MILLIIRYIETRCYVSNEYLVKFIKRNISDVRVTFSLRITVRITALLISMIPIILIRQFILNVCLS